MAKTLVHHARTHRHHLSNPRHLEPHLIASLVTLQLQRGAMFKERERKVLENAKEQREVSFSSFVSYD